MGKIYINLNSKDMNYLEDGEINQYDFPLENCVGKIVLSSMNDVKVFPVNDIFRQNKSIIQTLIQNGFKPINSDMELFLTQIYDFCPNCGQHIDINEDSPTIIYDLGRQVKNLAIKNIYPAKELICKHCGHNGLYYYDIYSNTDERLSFAKDALLKGATMYIRLRVEINKEKNAEIPILFDFQQFTSFFNKVNKYQNDTNFEGRQLKKNDVMAVFDKGDNEYVLNILFNEQLHEILSTEDNNLVDNILIDFKPIRLVSYGKYKSVEDFELIKKYKAISDSREKLKSFLVNKGV